MRDSNIYERNGYVIVQREKKTMTDQAGEVRQYYWEVLKPVPGTGAANTVFTTMAKNVAEEWADSH